MARRRKYKMDVRAGARIIKLASGPVPEGHSRWTLRLLEEKSKIILANSPIILANHLYLQTGLPVVFHLNNEENYFKFLLQTVLAFRFLDM